jgi:hypothetical protein
VTLSCTIEAQANFSRIGTVKFPVPACRSGENFSPLRLRTRSFSSEFKVSSVSGSGEQLTLDDVDGMSYLVIIHRMEIGKAKKLTRNRSRKQSTFCFLLGKPKGHYPLTLGCGCLTPCFCVCGKLSFSVSLGIGQNVYSSRIA